ncbi:MAG: hypothetical protein WBD10_15800 [Acidobacteriaceae bacterium]
MLCPSCRQEASGTFCNFCGATLATATAGSAAAVPVPSAGAGLSPNAAAAISYLTIIPSIIFLVIDPYKNMKLVKFHSIQNIALAVAWVAVYFALTIVSLVLHFIPFIGFLFLFLDLAVAVAFIAAWLICLIKASKGEFFKLPVIGPFAAKQAGV